MTIGKRMRSKAGSKKELREISRRKQKQTYKPKADAMQPSLAEMGEIERYEDLLLEIIKSSNRIKNEITKLYLRRISHMIPALNGASRQKKASANWLTITNANIEFDEYGRVIVNLIGGLKNDPFLESLSDENYDKTIFETAKSRLQISQMIIKDMNGYSEYEVK
jgi:hypothetical protein